MKIAPVVIIVFNRPDLTKKVFERVRQVKPEKLYIIADGPRNENRDDKVKTREVLEIFDTIDWECKVYKNIAENNMKCGLRISSGISWVFNTEEIAIILEDDCLPSPAFFAYCSELLEKYKNDQQIMHIAGSRYNEEFQINPDSYFFSRYAPIWGWATWKRAWKLFDFKMRTWPEFKKNGYPDYIFNNKEKKYWINRFDELIKNEERMKNIWDIQWQYTIFSYNGLCVIPKENMISNIGTIGLHNKELQWYHFRKSSNKFKPEKKPDFVIRNISFDRYHFKRHSRRSNNIIKYIHRKLNRILTG